MNKFKRAFITGGAQRIGSSITKFLANRGIDVVELIKLIENSIKMIDAESDFDWTIVPKIKVVS